MKSVINETRDGLRGLAVIALTLLILTGGIIAGLWKVMVRVGAWSKGGDTK